MQEYLKNSRIQLEFLPAYSPNLNLIERFWKFFNNKCSTTATTRRSRNTRTPAEQFFARLDAYVPQLRTLLTENFEIIGN